MTATDTEFRRRAHALVDQLPLHAGWTELAHEAASRRDIEECSDTALEEELAWSVKEAIEEYERMRFPRARRSYHGERDSG